MHLASPTGPAHATVSSDIMKMSFSATCWSVVGDGTHVYSVLAVPISHLAYPGYFVNRLLRLRARPSFSPKRQSGVSSDVDPSDAPVRYASEPALRYRLTVARRYLHLCGLAT
jgi:hypothetical protein